MSYMTGGLILRKRVHTGSSSVPSGVTKSSTITVSTVGPSSSIADVFEDELMTMADTLVAIRRTRPRTTSVVIHDPKEEPTRTVPVPTTQSQPSYNDKGKEKMVEPEEPVKIKRRDQGIDQVQVDAELTQRLYQEDLAELKEVSNRKSRSKDASKSTIIKANDIQAMIEADEQLAERLHSEEQEKYTIEEKARMLVEMITERKKFFTAQRAAEIRSKPPTKAHMRNRMCTYLKNQAGYTHKQLKGRSYDEIQNLFDIAYKQVSLFVPMDTEIQKMNIKFRGGLLGLNDFKMILRVTTTQLMLLKDYNCFKSFYCQKDNDKRGDKD
ncbi:hypothetical protein Tco_1509182 [Tanacetum coccineum]